jgi:thiol-disulfide isomerase/thioredoxin
MKIKFGVFFIAFLIGHGLLAQSDIKGEFDEYYKQMTMACEREDSINKNFIFVVINKQEIPKIAVDLSFLDGLKCPTFNAVDMNGEERHFDYKGKFTLVNFWFLNCSPCLEELPTLNKLQAKYRDMLTIVTLGLDTKAEIQKFIKTHPMDFINIPDAKNICKKVFDMCLGYPKNYLVGPDGKIICVVKDIVRNDEANFKKLCNILEGYGGQAK